MKKKENYIFLLVSCFCPVLIMSIALFICNMLPGQSGLLVQGDYTDEYLPFFFHFWDAFFHGKSLEYSFAAGMGAPTMAVYSIFAFSPCSIIPYLINDITLAAYLSLMLKISLSSTSFYFFLTKVVKSSNKTSVLFSFFYSLSSYVCIYYINIHFMDIFYILPILIYAMVIFVKKGKVLPLTGCYIYCFINNFFNGFCTGLFSALIYIMLLWYLGIKGDDLKKSICKYIVVVVTAVLLSAPVVFPTVFYVIKYMSGGSDFSSIHLNNPLKSILALLFGRTNKSVFNYYPMVYCGWASFLFSTTFFLDKAVGKKIKILAGVPLAALLICILWHPAYLMMHLFNEPDSFPWRFSYLFIFVICTIGAYEMERLENKALSVPRLVPVGIVILLTLLAYLIYNGRSVVTYTVLVMNLAFVLCYAFCAHKRGVLYIIMLLELLCATCLQLPYRRHVNGITQMQQQAEFDSFKDMVGGVKSKAMADGYYRIFSVAPSVDASLIYDFPGVDYFCSFENTRLLETLKYLGFGSRSQQYSYLGATDFTGMLLSVKYAACIGGEEYDSVIVEKKALPIAFMASDEIKEYKFASVNPENGMEDPFDNQQRLADAMTVNDRTIFEPIELYMYTEDISVESDDQDLGYRLRSNAANSVMYFYSDGDREMPQYMYLSTKRGMGIFDTEEIEEGMPFPYMYKTTPISVPHIYRMQSPDENSFPLVALHMNGGVGSETIINSCMAMEENKEAIDDIYDELSKGGLEIESFKDTEIKGYIYADDLHPVMFTSIPYDIDWRVFVDGEEYDTYPVINGTFLACDLPVGKHEVIIKYKDSSLVLGWKSFAAGLLIFILLALRERKYIDGNTDHKGESEAMKA